MTHDLLRQVLTELSRSAPPADADAIVSSGRLAVRGVSFAITEGRPGDPTGLFVQADFGPLPVRATAATMRRLLEINLQLAGSDGPAFGIDANNGHVAMVARLTPTAFTLAALATTLEQMAVFAESWRETAFLAPEEVGAPTMSPARIPFPAVAGRPTAGMR